VTEKDIDRRENRNAWPETKTGKFLDKKGLGELNPLRGPSDAVEKKKSLERVENEEQKNKPEES